MVPAAVHNLHMMKKYKLSFESVPSFSARWESRLLVDDSVHLDDHNLRVVDQSDGSIIDSVGIVRTWEYGQAVSACMKAVATL